MKIENTNIKIIEKLSLRDFINRILFGIILGILIITILMALITIIIL